MSCGWRAYGDAIFSTTAATILKVTYGYSVSRDPNKSDELVKLIDDTMREFSVAAVPMGWLVDVVPFLRHISFLPSSATARKYKKKPHQYSQHTLRIYHFQTF